MSRLSKEQIEINKKVMEAINRENDKYTNITARIVAYSDEVNKELRDRLINPVL